MTRPRRARQGRARRFRHAVRHDHGLDGLRCDGAGNLYISRYGAGRVAVVAPQGALVHEVALRGERPTDLAFGGGDGRTVFVTLQDRGAIESFRAAWPGRGPGGSAPQRAGSGSPR